MSQRTFSLKSRRLRFLKMFHNHTQLTYKQRMMGWAGCIGIAILRAVISILSLLKLAGAPAKFAVPYTLCNIFLLVSTFFLIGPKAQCRVMCKDYRALTSAVFVVSMILTLVVAFVSMNKALQMLLVLFFVCVQVVALVWYSLSFIPYGRSMCYRCCCKGQVDGVMRAVV